jgi:uncharacterized protein YidB (DUF937 family)
MGLLDELLGGMAEGAGGRGADRPAQGGAGGMGGVVTALLPVVLAMLANRGGGAQRGGGIEDLLGQVLGGGRQGGGMGDLLGQVLGGGRGAGAPGGGMGGLGELLDQFQRAGFGDQARSWVGAGQNQAITPDVIAKVFGRDGLSAIAARAGVSETEASVGLSQLLPEVVDRVTPQGQVPDLQSLTASVEALARQLGR